MCAALHETLMLHLSDVTDPMHWQWTLQTAGGTALAEHHVALDPASPTVEAWTNLFRYLRGRTFPPQLLGPRRDTLTALSEWVRTAVHGGASFPAICTRE
jgi:hypothetical protein